MGLLEGKEGEREGGNSSIKPSRAERHEFPVRKGSWLPGKLGEPVPALQAHQPKLSAKL